MKIKKHKQIVNVKKIKKANEEKIHAVEKVANFLELPSELVKDNAKLTIISNKYLYIEGSNQVMDYYDHYIKIKTKKYTITIDGSGMEIKEINENELVIEGNIINISYNK